MIRTQVQFPSDQYRRLKRFAHERGVSIAEAVRRCVDDKLSREAAKPTRAELIKAAESVIGKYHDIEGKTDVAENHDDYFVEAIESWKRS